jgi:hypothetical protein
MLFVALLVSGACATREPPSLPPKLIGLAYNTKPKVSDKRTLAPPIGTGTPHAVEFSFDHSTCFVKETMFFDTPMLWWRSIAPCSGFEVKLRSLDATPLPAELEPWFSGVMVWVEASAAATYKNPFRPDDKKIGFVCNCSDFYQLSLETETIRVPFGNPPNGKYELTVTGVGWSATGTWLKDFSTTVEFTIPLVPDTRPVVPPGKLPSIRIIKGLSALP